ncbi:MAG: hypothetical protein ACR2PF_10460 [Rhizobiaceae bacterium]
MHALKINDDWVFGVAETDITLVRHDDGTEQKMSANKTWLIERQDSGDWKIKRAMWNYR